MKVGNRTVALRKLDFDWKNTLEKHWLQLHIVAYWLGVTDTSQVSDPHSFVKHRKEVGRFIFFYYFLLLSFFFIAAITYKDSKIRIVSQEIPKK